MRWRRRNDDIKHGLESLPLSGRVMRFSPPSPGTFIPETETTESLRSCIVPGLKGGGR